MAEVLSLAKVSNDLDLVEIKVQNTKESEYSEGVNHVICIDVSGSMYSDIPKIRLQLKSNLVNIVNPSDTVTLLKFDDKAKILVKKFELHDLKDSKKLNEAVDGLFSGGCTNFIDPLKLTESLINESKDSKPWNFIFMSDGYHNYGGSITTVFSILEKLSELNISSSFIIEYGYCADSNTLDRMAQLLGAVKLFDEDFDSFSPDLDRSISKADRARCNELDLTEINKKLPIYNGMMFSIVDGNVIVYRTDKKIVRFRGSVDKIYYLTRKSDNHAKFGGRLGVEKLYLTRSMVWAASFMCLSCMRYDLAEVLFTALANDEVISMFSSAYGKQKIEELRNRVNELAISHQSNVPMTPSSVKIKNYSKRYCVLDFLSDISRIDGNKIYIEHEDFNYSATGAKSVNKVILSDEDKLKLYKSSTKTEAEKILEESANNQVIMKLNAKDGVPVVRDNLIWNSNRANVSLQMTIPVKLSVPSKSGEGRFEMNSKIFRNYTIIRDGVLNLSRIPMSFSDTRLRGKFKRMGLIEKQDGDIYVINISKLPIINKSMTTSILSVTLADKELELLRYRYIVKYLGYLKRTKSPNMKVSSEDSYLESLGISNGIYSPKTERKYSGDSYESPVLDTKLEKFSTTPKIEDVLSKVKSDKVLTESESFMNSIMSYVDMNLLGSNIDSYSKEVIEIKDDLLEEISRIKFGIILSRGWFQDKEDYDDNEVKVVLNDHNLKMKFVYGTKTIKL